MEFKKQFPLYERFLESEKVLYEYPDKVPVICEKDNKVQNCEIKKRKYLVSKELIHDTNIYHNKDLQWHLI
jgi:GABA(A) receptor-associated protein